MTGSELVYLELFKINFKTVLIIGHICSHYLLVINYEHLLFYKVVVRVLEWMSTIDCPEGAFFIPGISEKQHKTFGIQTFYLKFCIPRTTCSLSFKQFLNYCGFI